MKRTLLKKTFLIFFVGCFIIPIPFLYAQEIRLLEQINASDLIVTGKVKNIRCEWDSKRENIWTIVTIECDEFIKGKNNKNEITIRSLGGTIGELSQVITGAPKFQVGEILLGFLRKDIKKTDYYYCLGGELGKFSNKDGNWIQKNKVKSNDFVKTIKSIANTK